MIRRWRHHCEHAVGHSALGSLRPACAVSPAPKLAPYPLPVDGSGDARKLLGGSPPHHCKTPPKHEHWAGQPVGPPALQTLQTTLFLICEAR